MTKCVECGFENPAGSDTCLNCGSRLEGQKLSTAMDDVSGEATVLIGGHAKVPGPMPPSGGPAGAPKPKSPPPAASISPNTEGSTHRPADPRARDKASLGVGMLAAVLIGGVLVAFLLLAILFRLLGII